MGFLKKIFKKDKTEQTTQISIEEKVIESKPATAHIKTPPETNTSDSLELSENEQAALTPVEIDISVEPIVIQDPELVHSNLAEALEKDDEQDQPNQDDKQQIQTPLKKTAKQGILAKLKSSLSKTRHSLGGGVAALLLGKKEVNEELLDELETILITADAGVDVAQDIIGELTEALGRKVLKDGDALFTALKNRLTDIVGEVAKPLTIEKKNPYVILFIGVNGAGKTTTIGKLAKQLQQRGQSVMLAAGDTFRAAAVEQLQVWGQRNDIPVMAQQDGADSASVIFDALQSAKANNIDVLIADTAGRLHTKSNLMAELQKVVRVMQKQMPDAPHEIMLVLDASMGQNALLQAQQFHDAVGVTGITLTKLDGTAKGGILFAISQKLKIPIRFIGVGESIDDLREFEAQAFVDAVLGE